MTEAEKSALAQASVFRGGFDVDAADATIALPNGAPPLLDVLQSLREKSLLAAEKARVLAAEGYRTLLVCFNQRLATTMRRELDDATAPAGLTVTTGGTVNWMWSPGSTGHSILPDDGESPPPSGAPADWPKWHVFTFNRPGVYRYHCAFHGAAGGVGMSGTITVTDPVQP